MTLDEAYKILGIELSASEAERHDAFATKQKALEAKLGKAPTPGLKEKYRQALKQLEEAIETVEMAADGGLLPTLRPEREADVSVPAKVREEGANPKSHTGHPSKAQKPKQGFGKEIGVMIVVCLLMAGAAYWWFGIEQPKRAVIAYDAITVQIEALAETASDDELSDAERLLAEYLRTASAGHQAQANALLRERKNAVQSYRAVETARLEAEHLAEEKRLIDAKVKAEAEQKSLGRKVTKDLNALKVEASKLKAILGDAEDRLRDLKNAERDSAREDDGLRKTYDRIRRSRYEGYVNWLENYERSHPVKLAISNADDLARSSDLQAAVESIQKGVSSIQGMDAKILEAKHDRYGKALSDWVLSKSGGAGSATSRVVEWLRMDEPALLEASVQMIRVELAYLDAGGSERNNTMNRLSDLACIAGENDEDYRRWMDSVLRSRLAYIDSDGLIQSSAISDLDKFSRIFGSGGTDYVRWIDKVLPDLKIESRPSGATVFDAQGRKLGVTPLSLKNTSLGRHSYTLKSVDYQDFQLEYNCELNAADGIKTAEMKFIPAYLHFTRVANSSGYAGDAWKNSKFSILVDGKTLVRAQAGDQKIRISPGEHTVTVVTHIRRGLFEASPATEKDVFDTQTIRINAPTGGSRMFIWNG